MGLLIGLIVKEVGFEFEYRGFVGVIILVGIVCGKV